jgi:hypothetical protein
MTKRATVKATLSQQSKRFIEKARELGCDKDEAAFEERLKKVAKAKAPHKQEPTNSRTKAK